MPLIKLVDESRFRFDFAAVISYTDFLRLYEIPFFLRFAFFGIRLPDGSGSLLEIELPAGAPAAVTAVTAIATKTTGSLSPKTGSLSPWIGAVAAAVATKTIGSLSLWIGTMGITAIESPGLEKNKGMIVNRQK